MIIVYEPVIILERRLNSLLELGWGLLLLLRCQRLPSIAKIVTFFKSEIGDTLNLTPTEIFCKNFLSNDDMLK